MSKATKLPWEKLYIVVDAEGYPLTEHGQARDAFRESKKQIKKAGGKFYVAQLVLVADPGREDDEPTSDEEPEAVAVQ